MWYDIELAMISHVDTYAYGRFSKVHGLNVFPDPGIFELSEGILK